jgi:aerobic carbon-monoxide dehydrogenase large subunit
MASMIGQSVPRKEDARLLQGQGCFSDDVSVDGQAFAVMLRSPHAHARIKHIDSSAALAAPGALAVLTGADVQADGLTTITHNPLHSSPPDVAVVNLDGSPIPLPPHYILPEDKARFVGEPVAMVIADTLAQAKDAAELVAVDYEVLPSATGTVDAARADAPKVWDDLKNNVCIDAEIGDSKAADAAFDGAPHVVRVSTTLSRVTGVPMEPRAALGDWDQATGRITVYAGSGGAVRQKREIAEILGMEQDDIRVIAGDVGGNYGTRNALYVEFALVAWASRRLNRPVKWTADRSEALLTDYQARDLVVEAELAVDEDGMFLGLRTSNLSNIGSYAVSYLPLVKGIEIMSNAYLIPAAHAHARAVTSNTPPTYPYRSAGRPEVIYVMERLIDKASRKTGIDRAEIRRRNMVPESALPYDNGLGMVYDSGDFVANLEHAVRLGAWDGFEARRDEARSRGKLRGISIGNYIDLSTGAPVERAEIEIIPDGRLEVVIGTQAAGQGHETSFGQVVADMLDAPYEAITLIQGDTDVVKAGGGTHSGRSMRMGAIVLDNSSREIIEKGTRIAAVVLEASESDIEYTGGSFVVSGTDRSIGLFETARAAIERKDLPEDLQGPLRGESQINIPKAAFGDGCHVCEVEVDTETGTTEIIQYTAVDNVGRAINPMLIDGQTHGGIAQGVGQAMLEKLVYEPESGQALSGSFMDYAMPRADSLPSFTTLITEVPSPSNPLGVKPGSEGGTAPAPAVVANAIVDALYEIGVRHIEIPATPERVWNVIQDARR